MRVLIVASPGYQPHFQDAIYFESVAAAIDYIGNDNSQRQWLLDAYTHSRRLG